MSQPQRGNNESVTSLADLERMLEEVKKDSVKNT